jgi:hypothetical protein
MPTACAGDNNGVNRMANKGFLLVTMQPAPAFEEEFNAWYDSEHIPERLAVPGILTARRYVARGGHPRYLAMYDLVNHGVMSSPGYLAVGFDRASPWTKRVTSRVSPWRSSGDQVWPGDRLTGVASNVLLVRFRGLDATMGTDIVGAARRTFEDRPETTGLRVLAFDTGTGRFDYIVFVEQSVPAVESVAPGTLGDLARSVDLWAGYQPY